VVVTILPGPVAKPQAELQHVPGLAGVAPFRELVAPGAIELRAAQLVRFGRVVAEGDRAGVELEPDRLLRHLRLLMRREHRQDPALAEHHDLFEVLLRLRDQRNAPGALGVNLLAHPFGAAAGLAEAAAGQHQPCQPVAGQARSGSAAPTRASPRAAL
jgi:hypothetical protein